MATLTSPLGALRSRPWLSHMRLTLLIVALLATLTSATNHVVRTAKHTASATSFNRPSSTLPPSSSAVFQLSIVEPTVPNDLQHLRLKDRAPQSDSGDEQTSSTSVGIKSSASSSSTAVTTLAAPSTSTAAAASSPLPSPFDNVPSSAFQSKGSTDSCPSFMSGLLSSPTFKSCYPLSMMLQTSNSFFQAEKTLVGIVTVLDATCKADSASCTEYFDAAATNLTSAQNCKQELDSNQTWVSQAYQGLEVYQTMYAATCLQDPSANQYCFANAVTNLTTPSDAYLYFLPYGLSLPTGSNPSCSWCTKQTMAIYHAASAHRQQSIASTYVSAAQQINALCGSDFVNATLPPASSAAPASVPTYMTAMVTTWCIAFAILTSIL